MNSYSLKNFRGKPLDFLNHASTRGLTRANGTPHNGRLKRNRR